MDLVSRRPSRFIFVLLLVLSTALFAQEVPPEQTPPAPAEQQQEPPPPPPPPPPVEPPPEEMGEPLLEEITVTAQKREETVKDVPVAVTAMPDENIDTLTAGGADVKALSGRVPSLLIESSFGRAFPRFYIRGLGNTDFDLNASQPVSMVYDEVVLENPVLKGMPMFDLDRVEVLRGPQGTLFGRNTPAGIVKFESKQPSQDFEAYVRGSYGTYDTIDLKGAVGGGITDTLSARFAFMYQSQSDWVDNAHTGVEDELGGYENLAWRAQFLFEPVVRFKALLNVHGWEVNDGTARIFRANMIEHGTNEIVDGFDQETVYFDGLNTQDIESQGGVFKMDYAFDQGTLTSVTGYETVEMYSRGDIDGGFGASFAPPYGPGFIPFYSESADGIPDLDQFTQEIRYTSNIEGPLDYLFGAFYFDESFKAETFSYVSLAPTHPVEGYAFQSQDTKSWALFGSVGYRIADAWQLRAGLRYSQDEKDLAAERPIPLFFNVPTIAPVTASTDESFTSWDASATYIVSPQVNVYSRIATSFRAPSIQGRILFAPDVEGGTNPATDGLSVADTEEILSGEVGIKTDLLNSSLRLNATAYLYEVDGQQITAVGGEYNVSTLLNVDKTEGYGFETDVNWAPNRNWLTTLGVSFNHTEFKDPNLTVAPCGGGCTVLDPVVGGVAYIDGNSLPHAPEWIFNGIIDYKVPVAGGEFVSSLDWSYYSEKQFFLYESEEFRADGFETGLRFGYKWNEGKYEASLYGRNVTDEVIVQNGIDFNNITGMTNDPRMIGIEFGFRY
ncbi:MAG: TonB-dependent receptor [Thermoanaerobaculia bacterium]